MLYSGTIILTKDTYQRLLTDICASSHIHGLENIVLIGDSGSNQEGLEEVATKLNAKWTAGRNRVHDIAEYYDFPAVNKWLEQMGIKQIPEGLHDDFAMKAMMMTVDPTGVRMKERIAADKFPINGVELSPVSQTIEWGKKIVEFRANATVNAIRQAILKKSR